MPEGLIVRPSQSVSGLGRGLWMDDRRLASQWPWGEGRGARLLPWLSTPTACSGQEWLRSFDGQTLVTRDKELTGGRAWTLPSKAPQDGQSGFRVIHQGQGCILGHSQGLPCRSQQRHQETRVCLASQSVKLCSRNFAATLITFPSHRVQPTPSKVVEEREGGREDPRN